MAFARNISVPVIDTNIRRVLIFLFEERPNEKSNVSTSFHEVELMPTTLDALNSIPNYQGKDLKISKANRRKLPETITPKALEAFAETVIPPGCSRNRHNALMDQGALLLTARKTKIKPLSKQSKFEGSDRQVR
jgi:adenine-specific DNA glycosylase